MERRLILGVVAALASAGVAAGWQVASRLGATTTLGTMEMALMRYGVPAVAMAPIWLRMLRHPPPVKLWLLLAIVATGGLPFGLLVMAGAQWAPAAHIAIFMSGTMPLFAALIARLGWGEPVRGVRGLGFVLILAGLATVALDGHAPAAGSWRGDLLFLLAALLWAASTHLYRRSGLTPWQGTAALNAISALGLLALLPFFGVPRLMSAPASDLLVQLLWQGGFSGLLMAFTYMTSVSLLGATRAALASALVLPLTAAVAAVWLGEWPGALTTAALVAVTGGVALSSGAVAFRRWPRLGLAGAVIKPMMGRRTQPKP